jgi:hypothetical protein
VGGKTAPVYFIAGDNLGDDGHTFLQENSPYPHAAREFYFCLLKKG